MFEKFSKYKGIFEIIFGLLLIIAFGLLLINYRDQIQSLKEFGYLGVFVIALVSAATIFIPAPGLVLAASMGLTFNPVLIGLFGGLGAAIGEMVGFVVGKGVVDARQKDLFKNYKHLIEKYGFFAILVLSAIPNPLFDIASIAAGAVKMPAKKFFIATLIGNVIKYMTISFMFSVFGAAIIAYL